MPIRKKGKARRKRMAVFAAALERNLPRSEKWFREFWEGEGLKDTDDRYNAVWCRRIPDLVNHKFRYVIEIDGNYHSKKSQKETDAKKDRFYRTMKYDLFRVVAFKESQLVALAECVERLRGGSNQQPKTILRRSHYAVPALQRHGAPVSTSTDGQKKVCAAHGSYLWEKAVNGAGTSPTQGSQRRINVLLQSKMRGLRKVCAFS